MCSRQRCGVRFFRDCVPSQDRAEASQVGELSELGACHNNLARRLLAQTRRAWNEEPKKMHISTQEMHRKLGLVPIAKMAEQTQRNDLAHQQVLAAFFGQTRLDRHPGMTDDGILTFCATPWAKQF